MAVRTVAVREANEPSCLPSSDVEIDSMIYSPMSCATFFETS